MAMRMVTRRLTFHEQLILSHQLALCARARKPLAAAHARTINRRPVSKAPNTANNASYEIEA